jgi:hypothetical protein
MATKAKKFDAVEMSRALREATGRKLEAMTPQQRLPYLRAAGERHRAEIKARQESAAIRA